MPGDDADKINYEGAIRILRLAVSTIENVDETNGSFTWVKQSAKEANGMPADFMSRMMNHYTKASARKRNRGKFGVRIGEPEKGGLGIARLTEGGAAEEAGILETDILVSIGGKKIRDKMSLRRALAGKSKGVTLSVVVLRGNEQKVLEASLK